MNIWKCTTTSLNLIRVPVAACIGYFDGLHKGHMELVKQTLNKANELGVESALITFEPDPWVVIKNVESVQHLTTMKQRQKLAEKAGIDHFIVLDFTKEMSALKEEEFIALLKRNMDLKAMICGFDFHYGLRGSGNPQTLAQHGFDVVCVESINDDKGKISSTRICECIEEGNISEANELLGYAYTLEGVVIHGNAKGTGIGFPTANIQCERELLIPNRGVYIGVVSFDGNSHPAMINIGYNPTFNRHRALSMEAHILNFHQDIYDKQVSVSFCHKIRDEKKFSSIHDLIEQLKSDVKTTQEYFQ